MPEKIKISVTIEKQIWENFKLFVYAKHKKFRGVLGDEVGKALEEYVSCQTTGSEMDAKRVVFKILRAFDEFSKEIGSVIKGLGDTDKLEEVTTNA